MNPGRATLAARMGLAIRTILQACIRPAVSSVRNSCYKKSKCYWYMLFLWLLLCSYVLIDYFSNHSGVNATEIGVAFHLKMLVLTFPLGYFAGLVADIPFWIFSKVNIELSTASISYGAILFSWLMMVTIGFVQWFVWVPRLYIRARLLLKKVSEN